MILAKEFNRSSLARDSDLTLGPRTIPTIVQFGASSVLEFTRAARLVAPHVAGVDLNCGCPQSWACAESLGAALMSNRSLVADIVSSAKSALALEDLACKSHGNGTHTGKTVSVKIRVHKDLRETVDFVRTVQDAGVDFITIHGRTKRQRSSEPVDIEAIKLVAEHCRVPVIANGDVTSLTAAKSIVDQTDVQGVMSSRALLSNPALYAGHETCPWEAVESFMSYVVQAPLPFKLVLHHLSEMTADGGFANEDGEGGTKALFTRKQRADMLDCDNMLALIDYLDEIRELRRA